MTPEELDRKMEFIVEQQARFEASIQMLAERQAAFQTDMVGLKQRIDTLADVANTGLEIAMKGAEASTELIGLVGSLTQRGVTTDARIDRLAGLVGDLASRQSATVGLVGNLATRQSTTDDRLDRLAAIVEQHITDGHGGNWARRESAE